MYFTFIQWPFGTYKAVLSPILLPKQEIIIQTIARRKAIIELKGAVNFIDVITYNYVNDKWIINYSDLFLEKLKAYHCTILEINFDAENNEAGVLVSFPIISKLRINLKQENKL
tara:strand:+ start:1178 stop:1519 length:342 start_codon:yes stop_codon:yes gene_type:complete